MAKKGEGSGRGEKELRLSRTKRPETLSLEEWQRRLRRQFGREQKYDLENVGEDPFFSDFLVRNPQSKGTYRVEIRGTRPWENRCSCPDFATNELGTCKHVEFVLGALEELPGSRRAFSLGYRPSFSEVILRNDRGRFLWFRRGTECPDPVRVKEEELFGVDGRLPLEKIEEIDGFLALARDRAHEVRVSGEARDFIVGLRDAGYRRTRLKELFDSREGLDRLRRILSVPLYPYQIEGALFAVRIGRALIGDEMGLGKTVQAIAAVEILLKHFGVSRILVVCPASLKYQWQNEIKRFSGRESRVISGGRLDREKDFGLDDLFKITNYERLQPDLDLITAWGPELVIVDEAQRIKNWNTVAARTLKRIDSPYAIVLTGTPLENKLEELVSIVQFVDQFRLGPTWRLLNEHQMKDESGRVTGYTGLDRIGTTLAPILIRRRKDEVLTQLPERTDQNLLVPMTQPQMRIHQEQADIVAQIVARWRKNHFLSETDQRRLTCALQVMRMVCNSTYLVDPDSDHGVKADELSALLEGSLSHPEAKAVVFSQWTGTHDLVARRLDARGIGYVRFHGSVPADKRPALLERFRDDPECRVFLSTDAGASGLNLQHAQLLVNMDLPWNPALLEQRIARIHRMGQKRPVQIVNFVAKGTIEEGMLSVLAFKKSLSEGILDGGVGEISLGGTRLTRFMKEVENVTGEMGTGGVVSSSEETVIALPIPEPPSGSAQMEGKSLDREGREVGEKRMAASRAVSDPWGVLSETLMAVGSQLAAALRATGSSEETAHPWVERDPKTGESHLKVPLPPPETAARLGEALSFLASALRGNGD
jgi:hypothetical protein